MKYELQEQEVIDMLAAALGIKKGRGRFRVNSGKFSVIIESEADVLPFLRLVSDEKSQNRP
jgi:hypothetical protein